MTQGKEREGDMVIRCSVLGASSYICGELLRLMVQHPQVQVLYAAGSFTAGRRIQEEHPALRGFYDLEILPLDEKALEPVFQESDVIFSALEGGLVCTLAPLALKQGKKWIDFGADLRFRNGEVWTQWYGGQPHPNPSLTQEAVYGLPELMRDQLAQAQLIANPGCYPTATALGLYPALKEGLIQEGSIVVDAKSGQTGAGRKPDASRLLSEGSNNFYAYALGGIHRHTPEIEQTIAWVTGRDLMEPRDWQTISFQPHLLPQIRGIEATIYATCTREIRGDQLLQLYQTYYDPEYFVHVYPPSQPAQTKWTAGTNLCGITPTYDPRTNRLVISVAIDNMGKGAAGQALQNMNVIFGLEETTGLKLTPMYP